MSSGTPGFLAPHFLPLHRCRVSATGDWSYSWWCDLSRWSRPILLQGGWRLFRMVCEWSHTGLDQAEKFGDSLQLPGTVAVLLTRDESDTGNRTSVLIYAPDPALTGTTTISCGGTAFGVALQSCSTDVTLGDGKHISLCLWASGKLKSFLGNVIMSIAVPHQDSYWGGVRQW